MSRRQLPAAAVLAGPAVLKAPRPDSTRPHTTIDEITKELRGSGLEGWPLVDAAIVAVNAAFDHHSLWHLWESPRLAVANGRGWSGQYNQALARVLRDLGFDVEVVHAAPGTRSGSQSPVAGGHTRQGHPRRTKARGLCQPPDEPRRESARHDERGAPRPSVDEGQRFGCACSRGGTPGLAAGAGSVPATMGLPTLGRGALRLAPQQALAPIRSGRAR